jgi:N-acylglucosamine-6-phosphate 2-epimerase
VACLEDGIAARAEGADLVGSSTTGYPPDASRAGPDIALVRALSRHLDCPVVAERYYTTAAQIDAAFAAGAFAVVVGSAITDVAATTRRLLATHGQLGNSARAEPRIRP